MSVIKIDKKRRNLLLYSEITKDYEWLNSLLKNNEKIEVDQVAEELKDEFINVVPFVIKQAGEEWKGNEEVLNLFEDLGSRRKRCSLCNTKNRYVYYIQNKLNGKKLNVGSDCVEEFTELEFLQFGKNKAQLIKNARKVRRLADANKTFNGIDSVVDGWTRVIDRYDVVIPARIEKPYLETGEKLKFLYERFLNEKETKKVFGHIGKLLKKYDDFIEQMDMYQKENKDNKFVATRRIKRWLIDQSDTETLEVIKEEGCITAKSISKIYEITFVRRIEDEIVRIMEELELDVFRFDYEERRITFKPHMHNGLILLTCSIDQVMKYFGETVFGEKSFASLNMKNLIRICSVNDERSIGFLVEVVDLKMRATRIRLKLHDESFSKNEIDVSDIMSDKVTVMNLKTFIHESKHLLLNVREDEIKMFEDYLLKLDVKKYTKDELKKTREQGSSMSNIYKSLKDE